MTEDERNRLRERLTADNEDGPRRPRSNKTKAPEVFRNVSDSTWHNGC